MKLKNAKEIQEELTQNEFAEFIAKETLKIISEANKEHGNQYVYSVVLKFLGFFTEQLLTVSLLSHAHEKNKKESYTKTQASYNAMKINIQNQVGNAFSRALTNFSKQGIDYYCLVKPTPPPINKKAC